MVVCAGCRPGLFCPCRAAADSGIAIMEAASSPGVRGWYDALKGTIVVRADLTFAERRSTVAHELIHADRGDTRAESLWEDMCQEEHVRMIAARECITLRDLAAAVAESANEASVAKALAVDLPTLRRRISGLTQVEADYIDRVVKHTPQRSTS